MAGTHPVSWQHSSYAAPSSNYGVAAYPSNYDVPPPPVDPRRQQELMRSGPQGIRLPWFLPFYDNLQTLSENFEMRLAYRRMLADGNVKAALLGKILAVSALDLKVIPADRKDEKSAKLAELVRWNLVEAHEGGVPALIWNVLVGALVDGYSIGEKVWRHESRGQYKGAYYLRTLKPKDTGHDLMLVTDEFRNVTSVRGLRYNPVQEYHPSNFVIYRHQPMWGVPTGVSDLRAAYRSWWMLDAVTKLWAVALEKRSIPVLVGHFQTAQDRYSLEEALPLARSQSWLAVPEQVRIEALNIAGGGPGDFEAATQRLKHEIFLAVAGAILQAIEGNVTDGRGNSQVHRSTADLFIDHLRATIESQVLNDHETGLVREICDLNSEEEVEQYPRASLASVDDRDQVAQLAVVRGLWEMGMQLSKASLYDQFGLEPPDVNDKQDVLGSKADQEAQVAAVTMESPHGPADAAAADRNITDSIQTGANQGTQGVTGEMPGAPGGEKPAQPMDEPVKIAPAPVQTDPVAELVKPTAAQQKRRAAYQQGQQPPAPPAAPESPAPAPAPAAPAAPVEPLWKRLAVRFVGAGGAHKAHQVVKAAARVHDFIEHQVEATGGRVDSLLKEVIEQRGLSDKHAARIKYVTNFGNAIVGAISDIPDPLGTEGPLDETVDELGRQIPLGTLAYLAYSTARDPIATYRAAKTLIERRRQAKASVQNGDATPHDEEAKIDPAVKLKTPPSLTPSKVPEPVQKAPPSPQPPAQDDEWIIPPNDEWVNPTDASATKEPDPAAPASGPAAAPPVSRKLPNDVDGLREGRDLGGSTGAKEYFSDDGRRYVVKGGASAAHVKAEISADNAYRSLGIDVPESGHAVNSGASSRISSWIDGVPLGDYLGDHAVHPDQKQAVLKEARKGFVADALLRNWDSVGLAKDNMLVSPDGRVHRIDNGGSLQFRAQGDKKDPYAHADYMPTRVTELQDLVNPKINATAASVFKGISPLEVKEQIQQIIDKRVEFLETIPANLQSAMSERIDFLADQLDPSKVRPPDADFSGADVLGNVWFKGTPAKSVKNLGLNFLMPLQLIPHEDKVPDEARPYLWPSEQKAIGLYTGRYYQGLNKKLREGGTLGKMHQGMHESLQKVFARIKPFSKPVLTHRGMDVSAKYEDELLAICKKSLDEGGAVRMAGYGSTSTSPNDSFGGNFVFHVVVRKGLDVKAHSGMSSEDEILLDDNTLIVVRGIEHKGGVNHVHAEQIMTDPNQPVPDLLVGKKKRPAKMDEEAASDDAPDEEGGRRFDEKMGDDEELSDYFGYVEPEGDKK